MPSRFNFRVVGWLTALFLLGWGTTTAPLAAQGPWAPRSLRLELRGEGAWPTGELRDVVDERGFGFGAAVRYVPKQPFALYAGIDRFAFKDSESGVKTNVHDTGVRAGVQLFAPLGESAPVTPFVAGGVLYNWTWLKRTVDGVEREVHADPRFGFEAGGGAAVRIVRRAWLVPEVRYRRHEADVRKVLDSSDDLTVSYVGLNLGVLIEL
jgi:hypothetical protein